MLSSFFALRSPLPSVTSEVLEAVGLYIVNVLVHRILSVGSCCQLHGPGHCVALRAGSSQEGLQQQDVLLWYRSTRQVQEQVSHLQSSWLQLSI